MDRNVKSHLGTEVAVKTDDPLQDAKAAEHSMGSATGLALVLCPNREVQPRNLAIFKQLPRLFDSPKLGAPR